MPNGWLTPDAPTEIICRRVLIPDTMVPAFNGAVGLLGSQYNWEAFGGVSTSDASFMGNDVYLSFEDCEVDDTMLGSIQFYAAGLPAGVLPCDGATYLQVSYPDLYTYLGGVGVDFVVPDLREKFLFGAGATFSPGDTGGELVHTLTEPEMPAHTHPSENSLPDVDLEGAGIPIPSEGLSFPAPTGLAGGGLPHENMPPYHTLTVGIVALPLVDFGGGGGGGIEIGMVVDEKPQGIAGGTFSSGAWRTRVLNTMYIDPVWMSVSADQITLADGRYLINADLVCRDVGAHKAKMVRVSDGVEFVGQSLRANVSGSVVASVDVVGSESFYFQHYANTTRGASGFGFPSGLGVEVYSRVLVVKYG